MAVEQFLHGVEVIEIDTGARPISTVRASIIGIVGTAPDADPAAFPLNTPVLIAGSRREAALLDTVGDGEGTLPSAVDSIFDQAGAIIVVVRVEEGDTDLETLANVLGGVDANTGQYEGVHAFLAAESILGFAPRLLIAPGFTQDRVSNGVITTTIGAGGTGYTDGTYDLVVTGAGVGAHITATIVGGIVTSTRIVKSGSGYTVAPTLALPAGAGSGSSATFTATVGAAGNAVVAEMVGIAESLRAVIFADAPNTNDAAAIAYAGDWGSDRIMVCDPKVLKTGPEGTLVSEWTSAVAAGLQAKSDAERGWWWSLSNQEVNGIQGTFRAIDFKLGDSSSRANLLNEKKVSTIIRQNGFRFWGNRSTSTDPKFQFLCVRRTADVIADSLTAAHLWAVDRGITKNYVTDVVESVNAYLRFLTNTGAILGGQCWADPDLNTPDQIAQGRIYFDFDFTPVYPAERVTFRSQLVQDYIKNIFD